MKKHETAKIVARVADIDRRTLSETIVETWHEVIGGVDYSLAVEALRIVATESPDTIKPAHLMRALPAARAEIDRRRRRDERAAALGAARRDMAIGA